MAQVDRGAKVLLMVAVVCLLVIVGQLTAIHRTLQGTSQLQARTTAIQRVDIVAIQGGPLERVLPLPVRIIQ